MSHQITLLPQRPFLPERLSQGTVALGPTSTVNTLWKLFPLLGEGILRQIRDGKVDWRYPQHGKPRASTILAFLNACRRVTRLTITETARSYSEKLRVDPVSLQILSLQRPLTLHCWVPNVKTLLYHAANDDFLGYLTEWAPEGLEELRLSLGQRVTPSTAEKWAKTLPEFLAARKRLRTISLSGTALDHPPALDALDKALISSPATHLRVVHFDGPCGPAAWNVLLAAGELPTLDEFRWTVPAGSEMPIDEHMRQHRGELFPHLRTLHLEIPLTHILLVLSKLQRPDTLTALTLKTTICSVGQALLLSHALRPLTSLEHLTLFLERDTSELTQAVEPPAAPAPPAPWELDPPPKAETPQLWLGLLPLVPPPPREPVLEEYAEEAYDRRRQREEAHALLLTAHEQAIELHEALPERMMRKALQAEQVLQAALGVVYDAEPGPEGWILPEEKRKEFIARAAAALDDMIFPIPHINRMWGIGKVIHLRRVAGLARMMRGWEEVQPVKAFKLLEGEGWPETVQEKIDRVLSLTEEAVLMLLDGGRPASLPELEKAYDIVAGALALPQGEAYDHPFHFSALFPLLSLPKMREFKLQLDASIDFVLSPQDLEMLPSAWPGLESFVLNVNELRGHKQKLPDNVLREHARLKETFYQARRAAEDKAIHTIQEEIDLRNRQRRHGEPVEPLRGPMEIGHPRVRIPRMTDPMGPPRLHRREGESDLDWQNRKDNLRGEWERWSMIERHGIRHWNLPPSEPTFRALEQADSDMPSITLADLVPLTKGCPNLRHIRVDFTAHSRPLPLDDMPYEPSSTVLEKIDLTGNCRFDRPRMDLIEWCRAHWPNARINSEGMQHALVAPGRALKLSEFEGVEKNVPTRKETVAEQCKRLLMARLISLPEETIPTEGCDVDLNGDESARPSDSEEEVERILLPHDKGKERAYTPEQEEQPWTMWPAYTIDQNGKKRPRTPDSDDDSHFDENETLPAKRFATGERAFDADVFLPPPGPTSQDVARGVSPPTGIDHNGPKRPRTPDSDDESEEEEVPISTSPAKRLATGARAADADVIFAPPARPTLDVTPGLNKRKRGSSSDEEESDADEEAFNERAKSAQVTPSPAKRLATGARAPDADVIVPPPARPSMDAAPGSSTQKRKRDSPSVDEDSEEESSDERAPKRAHQEALAVKEELHDEKAAKRQGPKRLIPRRKHYGASTSWVASRPPFAVPARSTGRLNGRDEVESQAVRLLQLAATRGATPAPA
ncbi:hypothetical protein CALVIDRAFT_557469 [Calocera viscosa TUFC12733]|uniref:Uncharacterized protein n=1 Tax=Calocera viscosa (strain TUFC12733) TaxID=1330018 RepID=A0A167IDT9_CALVF|nr:hypothetical protein CALVIDRAFT_557469 [Calocera viscosa TUFC12733]